jgi:Flp pilus assembly protein TadD
MRQAYAHRNDREYGAAVDAYREAAEHDPASPQPWLEMGEVYLLQHRFAPATTAFIEAERRGGGVEAVLGLAESYAQRGDWAEAIRSLLRALAIDPDDARIYVALGRANFGQSQFEQAEEALRHALQLQPSGEEVAGAHALLGRLLATDDPVQAANHFRQAGDKDMLAVLDAVGAEVDAADAEPSPARRALLLGIAALQRSELPLARHHFERSVALAPADAEAHAYLAHTLDQLGETVAAGEALEQALALDTESVLVYYFLGTHHRLVGNVEEAQAALWEALLLDPENAAVRAEMAATFAEQSDYASAEEWYRGAVAVAPEEVGFHLMLVGFYVGHIYQIEEGALPAAQTLVELAPGDARAYDLLGWAYHLAGLHAEGERALLQALSLDSELVSAHYHLGSLYVTSGEGGLARQHLQRVVDLDTDGFYRARAELLLSDLR